MYCYFKFSIIICSVYDFSKNIMVNQINISGFGRSKYEYKIVKYLIVFINSLGLEVRSCEPMIIMLVELQIL